MKLSRAECIAIIRDFAKIPNDPKEKPGAWDALLAWTIIADDLLMELQRIIIRAETVIPKKIPHCPSCRCLA